MARPKHAAESQVQRFFLNSASAVFGIDWSGRIAFWNDACARMTGRSLEQVRGRRCCEVFEGTDLDGKPRCRLDCEVARKMAQGTSIHDYDMMIRHQNGGWLVVNVTAFATPPPMRRELEIAGFLSLRRLDCQRLIQRLVAERAGAARGESGRLEPLSPRETEILALAADGVNSKEIAARLGISAATVKNHFTNALAKLKAHSRAEAISVALRSNLI